MNHFDKSFFVSTFAMNWQTEIYWHCEPHSMNIPHQVDSLFGVVSYGSTAKA